MPLILPGNVASATAGAYEIANSCRFNLGDSPQLSKSVGSSATTKYTLSLWVKRADIGTAAGQRFLTSTGGSGLGDTYFRFNPSNIMEVSGHGSSASTGGYLVTNRVFEDPSAWYHIVVRYDSTESTANDRFRLYINGVDERTVGGYSTDTMPNSDVADNITADGNTLRIGATTSLQYCGMYMAEIHFSEGQSYAPTEFGEYDEDSPTIWKPKKASISYGTSGFYLDFEDSANLGNDANGGTDLSETNIAAIDQCTDTPTNSFCTLNPLDNYYQEATFSEGNCKVVTEGSSAVYAFVTGTIGLTAGKWYFEMKMTNSTGGGGSFYGVAAELATSASTELGQTANQIGFLNNDTTRTSNTATAFGDGDYTTDDIMMCALDMTNSRIFFGKNGVWMTPSAGSGGDPTDGTGNVALPTAVASTPIGAYLPAFGAYMNAAQTMEPNFGNPSFTISSGNADANGYGNFEYAVPSGYLAICTKNLGSDGG